MPATDTPDLLLDAAITALDQLAELAETPPAAPGEAVALLQALHQATGPSVIGSLTGLLSSLAASLQRTPGIDPDAAEYAANHLEAAASTISGCGYDRLDHARDLIETAIATGTAPTGGIS